MKSAKSKKRRNKQTPNLDRCLITLSPREFAAFVKLLDSPLRPNARLRCALRTRAPWE